ncbi:superoxide dismutase family protein [Rhodococcus rhodochrous]|uniref:Superoxide dismutase family protein n=1 Tax=Rhodococcus rhodochrous TaxID=1829 RepID=A0AA47ABI4_RHORH|nr:superoxide dismutase family protein [Rhodococcus rhodochrous]MCB8911418.1 superoxide dismutase family protein [Rhodococcus rhodochrous]UZF45202.1 superoxide dismutase family protein [Rhodococcus rhodochrous]
MNTRHACLVAGFSVATLVAAGCSSDDSSTDTETTVETPPTSLTTTNTDSMPTPLPGMSGDAFGLPNEGGDDDNAFTYDEEAVPVGATFDVESEDENGRTTVTLRVMGLQPDRDFGAHVHTQPCGPNPSDSGPHYQNQVDPAANPDSPSTDPAYANPQNEIWLDITTDAQGNAEASTTVDWEFRDGEANSVVLHDRHTMTAPGEAGQAGDRLACIDEDF